jgi:hypothetical protein
LSSASFRAESQLDLFDTLATAPPVLSPVHLGNAQRPDRYSPRKAGTTKAGFKGSEPRKKRRAVKQASAIAAVPGGAALCQRIFTRIGCAGPPPAFRVEFYPYSSLTLTIRRRDEEMIVRFSDLLARAPMAVLEGAAALLLAKIYKRRTPRALVAAYNEYAKSHRTRQRIQNMRSGRVRRAALDATGRHFDMNAMFNDLNVRFFCE